MDFRSTTNLGLRSSATFICRCSSRSMTRIRSCSASRTFGLRSRIRCTAFSGNHEHSRIRVGNNGGALLLAHQAGPFAERLAFAQGGQRILFALFVADDANFPISHDIQPAVLLGTLLQDFLAGAHALHTHAAREGFQLALVDLALEVEQVADQAARRADGDPVGDERTRRRDCSVTTGPMTSRGMNNSSVLPEERADHSCLYSRRMAISPRTSPALRRPRLVSFSPSEANTRIEPDLTMNKPLATSPAVHTVSPNASSRDCALFAKALDGRARQRRQQVNGSQEFDARLDLLRARLGLLGVHTRDVRRLG